MVARLLHGKKSQKRTDELFDMLMRERGQPKTFEHIARMALNPNNGSGKLPGIEALGILKADLDNLGLLLACGLRHQSLSRIATLSRQLDTYFSLYLPHLLKSRNDFRDIYTVFSGGDDLFLIGPWNRIIDFALFLQESFHRYACENKALTISTGIEVCKPGLPVLYFAMKAEERLKQAKDLGRDRMTLTLFGESVDEAEMKKLMDVRATLKAWLDDGKINNAMLYRLNEFIAMAGEEKRLLESDRAITMDDMECLKWKARFKYSLVRNVGRGLKGADKEKVLEEVGRAAVWIATHGSAMRIALWHVLYNQR